MASKREPLRSAVSVPSSAVRRGEPFTWSVRLENAGDRTLHVSHQIQSLDPHPDGTVLEVSTQPAAFADEVYVPFRSVPTVPLDPGEQLDQPFSLTFPLRVARFTGFPPRTEVEEWNPAPSFELVMRVAYGDRPFQPPARRADLAHALTTWASVADIPAIKLTANEEGDRRGVD